MQIAGNKWLFQAADLNSMTQCWWCVGVSAAEVSQLPTGEAVHQPSAKAEAAGIYTS